MPYPSGPTRTSARPSSPRYLVEEPAQVLSEAAAAVGAREAYAPVATYPGTGPSSTSRTILLSLLGLLVGGQLTWAYQHLVPGSGTSSPSTAGGRGAATKGAVSASAGQGGAVPRTGALTPTRSASQVPKNPKLSVESICVALALKEERLDLVLDAKRRVELLQTLTQLEKAEDQRYKAVVQMRAAFTEEQAKEITDLIVRPPFADKTGATLIRESKSVLGKLANGMAPPFPISNPAAGAERFDWDQSLRGSLALEGSRHLLTTSQAAQIYSAIPDWETSSQNLRVWGAQLNSQMRIKERQRLFQFQDALYNRRAGVEARVKADTGTLRLIRAAMAAIQDE